MPPPPIVKPGLALLAFASAQRLADDPQAVAWLAKLWEAGAVLGMDEQIPGVAPLSFPADDAWTDTRGYRVLASRQSAPPGINQAVLYTVPGVLGLIVLLAPEPSTSWQVLSRELTKAAGASGCDLSVPPAAVLGTAILRLGVLADPHAAPPTPGDAAADATGPRWPRKWTRVAPGFLIAQASAHASTPAGAAQSSGAADQRPARLLTLLSDRAQESALDTWTWSSARTLPPFARYLLHTATLRDQLAVFQRSRTPGERRRIERRLDELARLDPDTADLPALIAARTEVNLRRTDTEGLFAAHTRVRAMRRTVEIARANAAAAIEVPDHRDDHAHVFSEDTEIGDWLAAQLDDAEEYLAATLERADRMCAILTAGIDARLQRFQQQLTLLQTAVLGAVVMALTVVQTLQYHLPIPGPVQAPTIATAAGAALVLPGAALRWARGIGDDAPLRIVDIAALALPGAALGWLISSIAQLGIHAQNYHRSPLHIVISAAAAAVSGVLFPLLGRRALR